MGSVNFGKVLNKVEDVVGALGIVIQYTRSLDMFFKGDLDGKNIYIGGLLSDEEKLFNVLHLTGHTIQWNVDSLLRDLGGELYTNPSDELIRKLQMYEWEANCYSLTILHQAGSYYLDSWMHKKYILDMLYLTHFYKTGQKLKRITATAKAYEFNRELVEKDIPAFTPTQLNRTRNGLVIAF
ncbi:MAG TPA: hypothetical protein VK154_17680 [Chitinophagales bacterium]|nr:hypothetical protein [Chitinophagales bacterium]